MPVELRDWRAFLDGQPDRIGFAAWTVTGSKDSWVDMDRLAGRARQALAELPVPAREFS